MITEEQRSAFILLGNRNAEEAFGTLRAAGGMSRRARAEKMSDDAYDLMTALGVAREDRDACIKLVTEAMMARHIELEEEHDSTPGVV